MGLQSVQTLSSYKLLTFGLTNSKWFYFLLTHFVDICVIQVFDFKLKKNNICNVFNY